MSSSGNPIIQSLSLLFVLALSACTSDKTAVRPQGDRIDNLIVYARSLVGTPYQYGGHSPDIGFDCSGFVSHVFRHELGVMLPRTSGEISRLGNAVGRQNLRSGDLVFFNTLNSKFSHVGIYVGDDRFIHAPSKGGSVRVSNMLDDYWQRIYDGARRITARR